MKRLCWAILLFPCLCLAAGPTSVITLNPAVTHQKMTGWEASTSPIISMNPSFPLFKDKLYDEAVNDLGINRLRLAIFSGVENTRDGWAEYRNGKLPLQAWRCLRFATINDDDDPFHINWAGFQFSQLDEMVEQIFLPVKERVEARGEKLFLNINYVSFYNMMHEPTCPPGLQMIHTNPQEYAEFVLATYLHLKQKYGLVPDAWEVILEPDNTPDFQGKLIGEALAASAKRLKDNGFKPAFIAPSPTDMKNAVPYFDDMIKVPGVLENLKEFSYHRYRKPGTDEMLKDIGDRAARYHLDTSMLEHIGSAQDDLYKDLTIAGNSAWQQYMLAAIGTQPDSEINAWTESAVVAPILEASKSGDPKAMNEALASVRNLLRAKIATSTDDGANYFNVDTRDPQNPQVVMNSRTKYLRQYFKYIRSGAVRIDATASAAGLDPVAFINSDGRYVVVVKAAEGAQFSVKGLPAGAYGIKYTTADRYDFDLPDVNLTGGKLLTTALPAAGVLTVYARTAEHTVKP
jgi:hypothetical protein